jgi:transposase
LRKEQLTLDPEQLVFIDETAATTKMTRLYGRAPQGKRLVDKVPHGHWKTTTFICGLRYDGVTAPFVLDGPMDGPHFLAYVEQILAPTLKKGQIVFLDNVSTHKVDGVEEAIEARGARAVLTTFSKLFPKKNVTLISRTRDTPNLIEKCSSLTCMDAGPNTCAVPHSPS